MTEKKEELRFAECARCGQERRLIKVGKVWIQVEHAHCGEEFSHDRQ